MFKSILQIIYSCFVKKNGSKKDQVFEKWDHFVKGPLCKGYSPCKILALGQKSKFKKTYQNPFYKSFTVVLCKKPLEKRPNIREMRPCWKSAVMQRLYPMQNPHLRSKIKIQRNMSKSILQIKSFTVVLCIKQLEKRPNIREMRPFWKLAIMQRL